MVLKGYYYVVYCSSLSRTLLEVEMVLKGYYYVVYCSSLSRTLLEVEMVLKGYYYVVYCFYCLCSINTISVYIDPFDVIHS